MWWNFYLHDSCLNLDPDVVEFLSTRQLSQPRPCCGSLAEEKGETPALSTGVGLPSLPRQTMSTQLPPQVKYDRFLSQQSTPMSGPPLLALPPPQANDHRSLRQQSTTMSLRVLEDH
eukprot:g38492.t1